VYEALPTAQTWSRRAAETVLSELGAANPKGLASLPFVLMDGLERISAATGEAKYGDAAKHLVDAVSAGGTLQGYSAEAAELSSLSIGHLLASLQAKASPADKERYAKALAALRAQLEKQPRTRDGAFAHAKAAPSQLWLEDSYAFAAFLADPSASGDVDSPADAVRQLQAYERHLRHQKTGFLAHAFDETRKEPWANPQTGVSITPWGVATGAYALALVDALDRLPEKHAGRSFVVAALGRLARALKAAQDAQTGVWWQVLDAPKKGKNYLEASSSAMFVYALARGVRNGWLPAKEFEPVVRRGYRGILDKFVSVDGKGALRLDKVSRRAGPAGSLDAYASLETVANEPNALGAFIAASLEMEAAPAPVAPTAPPAVPAASVASQRALPATPVAAAAPRAPAAPAAAPNAAPPALKK
jgi:unsaturated rhamnogalacturonyl hydrolase